MTTPSLLTVATLGLFDEKTRVSSVVFFGERVVVSAICSPTCAVFFPESVIFFILMRFFTFNLNEVRFAVPFTEAVMVVEPFFLAFTMPFFETDATFLFEDAHYGVLPMFSIPVYRRLPRLLLVCLLF
mgnify:CR=1 FL=1